MTQIDLFSEEDYPKVGELITVEWLEEKDTKVYEVVIVHGDARLFTVKDSDGDTHMVAIDADGLAHVIVNEESEDETGPATPSISSEPDL